MNDHRRHHARGFTLIEVVISAAIASILLLAMTSAMILAGRAIPEADSESVQIAEAGSVSSQMRDELRYALNFAKRTSRDVKFTVPDRDGDGDPERIRYQWSGTAGDPLYRYYNGSNASVVIASVESLALTYDLETITETYPSPEVQSSEVTFSTYTDTTGQDNKKVEQAKWFAQTFRPTLPSNATRWKVTRGFIEAISEGPEDEAIHMRLEKVDDTGSPTGETLDEQILVETLFDSSDYLWYEINFDSNIETVLPGESLAFVYAHPGSGGPGGRVRYADVAASGIGYLKTDDSAANWSTEPTRTLHHTIYGQYWTRGADQTVTRNRITRVTIALQPDPNAATYSETAASLVNRPWDVSVAWRLTFDEDDPTETDYDGDGNGDWKLQNNGSFDPSNLNGGVWTATTILDSAEKNDFTSPVTIDARLRNTSTGGSGATIWINADWRNGIAAPIYLRVKLQGDGTQTVGFYNETGSGTEVLWVEKTGLASGFVDVRMVIDPTADTVATFVDGVHLGTFNYTSYLLGNDDRFVSIYGSGSSAEFDDVCVLVGGP